MITDPTCIGTLQQTSTMATQEKTHHMPNEHQAMISFPLLLKRMGVFILILIHFLPFVHKPLSHVLNGLL